MLGRDRVLLALALMTTAAVGCGGDNTQSTTESTGTAGSTTTTTTTGGSGGSTGSSSSTPTEPPLMCDTGEGQVLAVSELAFGEGSSGQWKSVGFNIDGLTSLSTSKDLCKPNSGADTSVPYPDGDNGIDNSFGKNLLPILLSLYQTWPEDVNKGIKDGVFTSLLKLLCLPPEGDVASMTTKLFGATSLPDPPLFDGTDKWPVAPELLADPNDPESSTVIFETSSIKGQTWDSGKNQTFILTVPLKTMGGETSIKMTLYAAHTTMVFAADRKSATEGRIGGVLDTEELVAEIKKVGFLLNLCDTTVFNDIITQIRQASDILVDGTQDPNQTCNGISLGLGFKMMAANLGDVGPATAVGQSCN